MEEEAFISFLAEDPRKPEVLSMVQAAQGKIKRLRRTFRAAFGYDPILVSGTEAEACKKNPGLELFPII